MNGDDRRDDEQRWATDGGASDGVPPQDAREDWDPQAETRELPAAGDLDPDATAALPTPTADAVAATSAESGAPGAGSPDDATARMAAVGTHDPDATAPVLAAAPGPAGSSAAGEPREAPADPARRQRGRRAALIAGALVLLLALGASIWWWWDSTNTANRQQAIRDTATAYLTALADADAPAALATLDEQPRNTALLNSAALQASREAAPLTDVAVTSVDSTGTSATADVTYRLGEQAVQTTLALVGDGRTEWRIVDGTADLTLATTHALTLNGVTLAEATNPVFPGTYTAAPANPHLALNGTTQAVLPSPDAPEATLTPEYALSEAGSQAVLATVRQQFDNCLASTESLPANCPFGVDPGPAQVTPGSVRFQLTNDPWAGFAPTLDPVALTATGGLHFEITAFANVTFEGRSGDVSTPIVGDRTWTVDLTQDPLRVVWA